MLFLSFSLLFVCAPAFLFSLSSSYFLPRALSLSLSLSPLPFVYIAERIFFLEPAHATHPLVPTPGPRPSLPHHSPPPRVQRRRRRERHRRPFRRADRKTRPDRARRHGRSLGLHGGRFHQRPLGKFRRASPLKATKRGTRGGGGFWVGSRRLPRPLSCGRVPCSAVPPLSAAASPSSPRSARSTFVPRTPSSSPLLSLPT